MLNPILGTNHSNNNNNYLLRHSSANTSLNESSSPDALAGNGYTSIDANHDDIFSIIEQAGITFGKNFIHKLLRYLLFCITAFPITYSRKPLSFRSLINILIVDSRSPTSSQSYFAI